MPEIIYRPINSIKPLANNPRQITAVDFERLCKSVEDSPDYFEARPLILSDRTGELVIIAGNMRHRAAKKLKLKQVPTILLPGLSEEREREIIIRDNVNNGSFDWDSLANEWSDLPLAEWGVDIPEDWAGNAPAEAGAGGDEFEAEPDEQQTRVQYGDLWQCGRHRVLCGDSTKAEDVARLMGGEKAALLATDPPYGVDYEGIENDKRKILEGLLRAAVGAACSNSHKGASVYMFHADKCADIANKVFREFCHFSSMIIWVKPSLVMGQSDYHSRHEPCLYGWFSNGTHNWYGDRKGDSVWELGRESSAEHTTPKPVDFFIRAIGNSSQREQIIYDPFLGSGTTLIAAERTGRKCYGIEISPKYVDVILTRYEAETGNAPELIERL